MEDENKFLIERNGRYEYYDLNLYPANLINPETQLFITPTGESYIVRSRDTGANGVSHYEFAKMLVNSKVFALREFEEKKLNPNAKQWSEERNYAGDGKELEYLIEEKGFILFSPPPFGQKKKFPIPRDLFPKNLSLLTNIQINTFLTFYEREGTMELPKDFEETLYQMVVTKKK